MYLRIHVTFVPTKFTPTGGDRSIELTENFVLMYRYLNFDIANASADSFVSFSVVVVVVVFSVCLFDISF